jgi:hypothetical protein
MSLFRSKSRAPDGGLIPAFLSFDVEPDGFQLHRGEPADWAGYDAMVGFAEQLRSELAERSVAAPKFGWYFRADPQIAEVYGRPDYALTEFSDRTAQLKAKGDYFGVHAHPIRWCEDRRLWVHDFADAEWLTRCTRFSLEAYARWAGSPARRFRAGAGFLSNEIVDVIEQCGVKVDLSLEPVAGWGLEATDVPTSLDASPIVGNYTDCRTAPRVPFRPARHDFRVPSERSDRSLVMVPLATTALLPFRPLWKRIARRLVGKASPPVRALYPSGKWPSSRFYWDLVARELRSMRRPYLSLAIRTDAAELSDASRVREIFNALPTHPLAERLRFVDPLDAAPRLV